MRLRWIIIAGLIGLVVAWREASLVGLYIAMIGCMILYALRTISLQRDEYDEEVDDAGIDDLE
jgi:hypothetical protein